MRLHLYTPGSVPWDDGRRATRCGRLVNIEANEAAASPCRACLARAAEQEGAPRGGHQSRQAMARAAQDRIARREARRRAGSTS